MTRNKMVNGEIIALTAEEDAARDVEEAQAAIDKQAEIDAATKKATDKVSANTKLKDLGLTDDEIEAFRN
tara:strand:- start:19 stop:228 length:210 start_codon:yes stop_codon:yes gene_type:complete